MKLFSDYAKQTQLGTVSAVAHGWVQLTGLESVSINEIVIFENDVLGQITTLGDGTVDCLVFSNQSLKPGMQVARTDEQPSVIVNPHILGTVVNGLGVSETAPLQHGKAYPIFHTPPGLPTRAKIHRAFFTGVKIIDLLLPLGKGQRELIIGDRKTGKTNFLLETMRFQMNDGAVGIYAGIGKKKTDIKKVQEFFAHHKLQNESVIVASSSDDPAGMIFATPYTAMAIAEYFRDLGKDVILILDDLTTHAKFYRESSLIANRFPGRNAYPSDIFSVHAKLLERAGNFKTSDNLDVSITCLPVVETLQGDLSGYIQTNVMSMTDGHLLFDGDLFAKNRRPAINPFLSVTRVGKQTQDTLQREITTEALTFLATSERLQSFTHFGAELHDDAREKLLKGEALITFFNQNSEELVDQYLSIFMFAVIWSKQWPDISLIPPHLKTIQEKYETDAHFQEQIYTVVSESESIAELTKQTTEILKGITA